MVTTVMACRGGSFGQQGKRVLLDLIANDGTLLIWGGRAGAPLRRRLMIRRGKRELPELPPGERDFFEAILVNPGRGAPVCAPAR